MIETFSKIFAMSIFLCCFNLKLIWMNIFQFSFEAKQVEDHHKPLEKKTELNDSESSFTCNGFFLSSDLLNLLTVRKQEILIIYYVRRKIN